MSNTTPPPLPPAYTGPGSPQDVPPLPGSFPIDPATLPDELEVSARTDSGVIMGLRHKTLPVESVQFHPESVLTEGGYQMLANWLAACGDADAPRRAEGLAPLMAI